MMKEEMCSSLIVMQLNIVKIIKTNDTSGSMKKFQEYLNLVESVESYSQANWPIKWIMTVREFSSNFRQALSTINTGKVSDYLSEIRDRIRISTPVKVEVFEFILLELGWDSCAESRSSEIHDSARRLYEKYPHNCEFKNTYAHSLMERDLQLEKAIELYEGCLEEWGGSEKAEDYALANIYFCQYKLANKSLREKDYTKVSEIIRAVEGKRYYRKNNIALLSFEILRERSEDMKVFDRDLKDCIIQERKRSVELLGVFTAIISFIITAVNVVANKPNIDLAISVLLGMALSLILFLVTISILWERSKKIMGVRLLVGLIILIAILALPRLYSTEFILQRKMSG